MSIFLERKSACIFRVEWGRERKTTFFLLFYVCKSRNSGELQTKTPRQTDFFGAKWDFGQENPVQRRRKCSEKGGFHPKTGPNLAQTRTGIQVQMTGGKVTQLSDGQRVLYDIATVQGSSGSPVIDTEGNLVAVNFAKLNGSDNFNFGIPLKRVKEFMKW